MIFFSFLFFFLFVFYFSNWKAGQSFQTEEEICISYGNKGNEVLPGDIYRIVVFDTKISF